MKALVFWFEMASTYSYLSAMRIEEDAARAGVQVVWRPFLLGPIFRAQGWASSPFNVYPAKGRYMIRDMERLAAARALPFRMPATFPANGIAAARMAIVAARDGVAGPFVRAVYTAQFGAGADISNADVLSRVAEGVSLDFARLSASASAQDVKDELRRSSEEAQALGIFGAPTFQTADGELFWGDDRLDQALGWSSRL